MNTKLLHLVPPLFVLITSYSQSSKKVDWPLKDSAFKEEVEKVISEQIKSPDVRDNEFSFWTLDSLQKDTLSQTKYSIRFNTKTKQIVFALILKKNLKGDKNEAEAFYYHDEELILLNKATLRGSEPETMQLKYFNPMLTRAIEPTLEERPYFDAIIKFKSLLKESK